jgi:hypothetical protein
MKSSRSPLVTRSNQSTLVSWYSPAYSSTTPSLRRFEHRAQAKYREGHIGGFTPQHSNHTGLSPKAWKSLTTEIPRKRHRSLSPSHAHRYRSPDPHCQYPLLYQTQSSDAYHLKPYPPQPSGTGMYGRPPLTVLSMASALYATGPGAFMRALVSQGLAYISPLVLWSRFDWIRRCRLGASAEGRGGTTLLLEARNSHGRKPQSIYLGLKNTCPLCFARHTRTKPPLIMIQVANSETRASCTMTGMQIIMRAFLGLGLRARRGAAW